MSSLSEEVDMLRRVPLFAQIEPSKLKLLAFTSERLAFDANQDVFRQGDEGDAAYVIMQGSADVVVNTPKGETVVAVLSDNAFIGEIAILCDVPRTSRTCSMASSEINPTAWFNKCVNANEKRMSPEIRRKRCWLMPAMLMSWTAAWSKLGS